MMRRVFLGLLLLSIVAAAAWTVLRWNNGSSSAADPWSAIPAQAAVIVEVPDAWAQWDRFANTSLLWSAWEKQPGTLALSRLMTRSAHAMEKDAMLLKALGGSTVLVALMRNGSKGAGFVAVGTIHGEPSADALGDLLGVAASERSMLTTGQVTTAQFDAELAPLSFALRQGLWMLSDSPELLEEALLQQDGGLPITTDTLFAQARATLGKGTDAHVLLNTSRTTGLLSNVWQPERLEHLGIPEGWLALDVSALPEALLMSGLLVPASQHPLISSVTEQASGPWNIGRVLPESVVQWEVRNVSNAEEFLATVRRSTESVPSTEVLFPWAYGSAGIATAVDTSGRPARRWLVMNTEDPEGAREELSKPCGTTPCDTLNHRGTRITHFAQTHSYEQLLGKNAILPQQPWWAILGNTVVMSDDADAVRASIDTWNDGNSLAENKRASTWFQQMSDEAGFTWWCDLARGGTLLSEGSKTDRASAFSAWLPVLRELGGLSIQVSPAQHGLLHVSIGLQHAPSAGAVVPEATSNVLWSCAIDAPVQRTPDIVINHTNNTREVLVQDTLHRIHLISATGKVLWSRALDGPILGAVHQVDHFKNGKLQLLFNTTAFSYLIDRNGKDVGSPLKIPSAAAVPLSVIDYEGQREYRILIPGQDGRINNLTLDWTGVQGWVLPKLPAPAIEPVRHLRIRNQDHLLIIDNDGGISVLDRKGNERERVKTKLARVKEVHAVIPGSDLLGTRVHWLDQDLVLHETTLGGEERRTISASNGRSRFMDLDGDGAFEVVRITNDSLIASNAKGLLFAKKVGEALLQQASAYSLGANTIAIGMISPSNGKAWLFDGSGRELPGMCVDASTPFVVGDLNLDGAPELVTATNARKVVAYRMITH